MRPISVHKYGGSVLRGRNSFGGVIADVARAVAAGRSVVAVVSAFEGTTDSLVSRARAVASRPEVEALDLVLSTGEVESAALLALALNEADCPARVLNPFQIGIETDGAHGAARVTRIDPATIFTRLSSAPVVVVPGFLGRGPNGALTTLGRGGSDLSAIALAAALGAERLDLVKDVPGYFSADPAIVPDAVHRPRLDLGDALELARRGNDLVQARALERASRFVVRSVADGRGLETLVDRSGLDGPAGVASLSLRRGGEAGDDEVSAVGPDPGGEREARAELLAAGLSIRGTERTERRLTVAVAAGEGERALAVLHRVFVREAAGAAV